MHCKRSRVAFTRLELMVLLGAAALLFAVAVPGLANSRNRSQSLVCMDNLRQIGQGLNSWAFEHGDSVPWLLYQSEGGTRPMEGFKPSSVSREFSTLSNELASPKVLACPNDSRGLVKPAESWGFSSNGGYLNAAYRENVTSYTIGLHAFVSLPQAVMSSDRHLKVDFSPTSCSYGVNNAAAIYANVPNSYLRWTNTLHGGVGNILTRDGRVAEVSNSHLRFAWNKERREDNGVSHVLIP